MGLCEYVPDLVIDHVPRMRGAGSSTSPRRPKQCALHPPSANVRPLSTGASRVPVCVNPKPPRGPIGRGKIGHDLICQSHNTGTTWETHYYGYDGHGSVRYLTDAGGAVTDTYEYDAFGTLIRRTGTTDNNYLYTGEQYDSDLHMYFLRARYMDTDRGRFWNMDSFEGRSSDPTSLHKYLYANANPVTFVDPTGLFSIAEFQSVWRMITTLGHYIGPTLRAIYLAQSVVAAVESVKVLYRLINDGQLLPYLKDAKKGFGGTASSSSYGIDKVIESFDRNYQAILATAFDPWRKFLMKALTKGKGRLTSFLVYLPNPTGNLPQLTVLQGKLAGKNVRLIAGGRKPTRVFGVGLQIKGLKGATDLQQIWRMDFDPNTKHTKPNQKELDIIIDHPFQYHINKPPKIL